MAITPQMNLLSWNDIKNLGDLDRLRLVIGYLPDEKLMQFLRKYRKNGRDDYPIRVVWNTILAAMEEMEEEQPTFLKNAETMAADRGYDDMKFSANLRDNHEIKSVIAIRNMWKD